MAKLDEKEIIELCDSLYTTDIESAWRKEHIEIWKKCHDNYIGTTIPKNFPWPDCSNLHIPITEWTADNITARLKSSIVGSRPWFDAIPVESADVADKTRIQQFMDFILQNDIGITSIVERIAKKMSEYGTCITKRRWMKTNIFKEGEKVYTSPEGMEVKERSFDPTLLERGIIDIPELIDIVIPEDTIPADTPDMELQYPFCHHVIHISRFYLDQLEGMFPKKRIKSLKEYLEEEKPESERTPQQQIEEISTYSDGKLTVCEFYIHYKGEEWIFVYIPKAKTLIAEPIMLRYVYNDDKRPFNLFRYKNKDSIYGRGIAEELFHLQSSINTVFNQYVDCMTMQIIPWGAYVPALGFDPVKHKISPGVMMPVDDTKALEVKGFAPTAHLAVTALNIIVDFIEKVSGISAPQLGKEMSSRRTATEVGAVIGEGNIRHQDRAASFQESMAAMLKGIYRLYKDNITKERTMRILGIDYKPTYEIIPTRENMPEEYDFLILGSLTGANKMAQREDSMILYQTLLANPLIANNPVAVYELTKDLIAAFDKKNIGKLLPPDLLQALKRQPIDPEEENMLLMQGFFVPPQPEDDHLLHVGSHFTQKDNPNLGANAPVLARHILAHLQMVNEPQPSTGTNIPMQGMGMQNLESANQPASMSPEGSEKPKMRGM